MLQSYLPIYQLALDLQALRGRAELLRGSTYHRPGLSESDAQSYVVLLKALQKCSAYNFYHTAEMAKRIAGRTLCADYNDLYSELTHLNDSLSHELEKEAVFRIAPEQKDYFERNDLFGPEVAAAFPSCERDIRKAGSCYALRQEDACVHHLMLVLEPGLYALAAKVGLVSYQHANWQTVINQIETQLKSSSLPPADRDFYRQANAQFGFLKEAYRNHSAHTRDDHCDMEKALSILNHVRGFMQAIEKGGLAE